MSFKNAFKRQPFLWLLFFFLTFPALLSYPFLDLWKRNAVPVPKEYSSSESGASDERSPLPIHKSIEVSPFKNGDSELCPNVYSQHLIKNKWALLGIHFKGVYSNWTVFLNFLVKLHWKLLCLLLCLCYVWILGPKQNLDQSQIFFQPWSEC